MSEGPRGESVSGHTLSRQAGVMVLGTVASTLAEVISPLLLVRILEKDEVGRLAALLVVYQTASMIAASGYARTVLYYLPQRSPWARGQILARITLLLAVLGGLAGIVLAATGAWFSAVRPAAESIAPWLPWVGLYVALDVPTRLVQPTLMAEGRARSAAAWGVARSLLTVLATLVPAALGWGPEGVLIALCAVTAALFGNMLLQGVRHYGGCAPDSGHALPGMREISTFALPLGLTDWVNTLNKTLDRYLVMGFFPTSVYADYQVGAWQIPVLSTLPYAVGNVSLPEYKRRMAAGEAEQMVKLWRDSIARVSLAVVPVAFAFMTVATPFIEVVFTAEYLAAVPIFQWYTVLLLGRVSYYGAPILASGKSGWLLWASAFTLVSNATISLPLCWWLGYTGPAAGSALAFIPTVALYCVFISKATGVPVRRIFPFLAWLRVVVHGAAAAGVGWLVLGALDAPAWVELSVGLLSVLGSYAAIATLTGLLGPTEWAFVRDWVRLRVLRDEPQAPRGLP